MSSTATTNESSYSTEKTRDYNKETIEDSDRVNTELSENYNINSSRSECICKFSSKEFLSSISNSIECIIDKKLKAVNSIFDNESIPKISIKEYLIRIMKYCKINKSTIVIALVYIDRLPSDFFISMYNIHKVILSSILVASKINEDKIHTNYYFAKVGGINLFEMNLLEIDFLKLLEYNLLVDSAAFIQYVNHIRTF
jgi:hypothetical protein